MIVALDIGGTKTLIASFTDEGSMSQPILIATERNSSLFLSDVNSVLSQLSIQSKDIICIASAGFIDKKTRIIKNSPNLGWTNFDLRKTLAEEYKCQTYLGNDATIGGLGAVIGLERIPPLVLYVTLGTGIGGTLVINGKIVDEVSEIEIGHMVFYTDNGLRTWESFSSGHAVSNSIGHQISEIVNEKEWEYLANQLVVGFRALIPALLPNLILIGGGASAHFDKYEGLLRLKLRQQIPEFIDVPPILNVIDPETVVLRGCYKYAHDLSL